MSSRGRRERAIPAPRPGTAPTLAEFEQWARAGDITFYVAGSRSWAAARGGQGSSSQITAWRGHYKSATIGDETVYLLLQPKS